MTDLNLKMPKKRAPVDGKQTQAAQKLDGDNKQAALFVDRRKSDRSSDLVFRLALALNVIAWLLLCISLIVFHYARPEFIAGVQNYWGIEGRESWSQTHLDYLLGLLQACLVLSFITIIVRAKRNRRKTDSFGLNLVVLLVISILSLLVLYIFV